MAGTSIRCWRVMNKVFLSFLVYQSIIKAWCLWRGWRERRMKKILSMMLVVCLCCEMLAGCSEKQEDTSGETVEENAEEVESAELPFDRTFDDAHEILGILQSAGKFDFTSDGEKITDDGTMLETLIDTTNNSFMTILGDEDGYITLISTTAEDEETFAGLTVAILMMLDIATTDVSEFLANFSSKSLENMGTNPEDSIIEVINGISYLLEKSGSDGAAEYRLTIQRDYDTREDYEAYLEEQEIWDGYYDDSNSNSIEYAGGMYKIGADMPAGEYLLTSIGGYYEIATDSTGSLDSIVTNGNYTNRGYVTVQDGQYFTFEGTAVSANEAPAFSNSDGIYPEGMYLVGKDIPAGEYKISSNESGYYEVTSDSVGGLDSIVTNENFEGDVYLTVSEGQYLKLSRAQIITN